MNGILDWRSSSNTNSYLARSSTSRFKIIQLGPWINGSFDGPANLDCISTHFGFGPQSGTARQSMLMVQTRWCMNTLIILVRRDIEQAIGPIRSESDNFGSWRIGPHQAINVWAGPVYRSMKPNRTIIKKMYNPIVVNTGQIDSSPYPSYYIFFVSFFFKKTSLAHTIMQHLNKQQHHVHIIWF